MSKRGLSHKIVYYLGTSFVVVDLAGETAIQLLTLDVRDINILKLINQAMLAGYC